MKARSDMRTPLARARGPGGLPEGAEHWTAERVSALLLGPLSLWAIAQILRLAGRDRDEILQWAGKLHNAAPLGVLIGLTARHMQLGLEVVATDYARGWRRVWLRLAIRFGCLMLAAYGGVSIMKILQTRTPDTTR
ncbi:succinate dehydrogenase subunit D [Neoasaia chiangmaiensis NBRC 101099]|uniref:Succinate dehydrogenase hydrophobic membrane anchor subunit n=1 Tax=Neoasaia chiangmaiensis TaxID=320497 RepID=A0A1U9KRH4_9PROT|nr:succinate dehydrogenase, hydrophobic membrane anchor protein [Neoasaia chiangmaiensis]AQS88406.1 hypothetical protein A0U93_11145 [Neoasaia chiangmaiensis]GBR39333.1 succinate dehydrogenase subunit D [Neoasaia chiangmaiensis NBRC 101099]GEN14530.1 succinate dehydrogenase, hydrophobic membrane anchor protein [Neoasaia chiangmaiensis]